MRTVMIGCAVVMVWAFLAVSVAPAAELTVDAVRDVKGDGPDGKGNTVDDTWGFWFELVQAKEYRRLDLATANLSADQRANGIRDPKARRGHQGKVRGPIGAYLPNKDATEGWIYHSDWDGRFEGVWGDTKAKQIIAHPYTEKTNAAGVGVTYKVPADGLYTISGKVTDMQVTKMANAMIDGITVVISVAENDAAQIKPVKVVGKTEPIGDTVGPESREFKFEKVALKKGQLVLMNIDPNKGWGADMTRIDSFKIEPVTAASANWKTPALAVALLAAAGVAGLLVRRVF
ncbi:MAG: hypothetical protein ABFD92_09565 [Planctomycetaceae bacterium]|nr:hypothetical protein [Planctomycetaceae bacterium]